MKSTHSLRFPSSALCPLASARRAAAQRRRVLWLTALVACVALGGAGCAKRETPVQAGIRTQTLHFGNVAEPVDLDPHVANTINDGRVHYALFEGLTWVDEKSSQAVPAAAERWEVSPNGLVYTFQAMSLAIDREALARAVNRASFSRLSRASCGKRLVTVIDWPALLQIGAAGKMTARPP